MLSGIVQECLHSQRCLAGDLLIQSGSHIWTEGGEISNVSASLLPAITKRKTLRSYIPNSSSYARIAWM